jgi:hypothetical protein
MSPEIFQYIEAAAARGLAAACKAETHAAAKGMARAADHAGEEWQEYALQFVYNYLENNSMLFTDDLWLAGLREPASPRALGAVLATASRHGWMSKHMVGNSILARPSTASNGQLKAVWQSRLFKP